jgi:WD repeat-containing protein 26
VSEFRQCILDASWDQAESALLRIGVSDDESLAVSIYPFRINPFADFTSLQEARFLINQQRYLELLEDGKTGPALSILRSVLAPLNVDPDQLHVLSRYAIKSPFAR